MKRHGTGLAALIADSLFSTDGMILSQPDSYGPSSTPCTPRADLYR